MYILKNNCFFLYLQPYEPLPPRAAPSRSKIARQFDEAFTKLNKDGYDISLAYTDLIRRGKQTSNSDASIGDIERWVGVRCGGKFILVIY